MDLFELKDEELKIHPAAFALTPFRSLWVRKGRKKERATQELAYIYFMLDLRSDFRHVYPEREREKLIIQTVGLPPDFKPDALVKKAMVFYESMLQTTNIRLMQKVRKSFEQFIIYFDNIDFALTDKSGKPVHDINKYKATLKELTDLIESVDKFEKTVLKQLGNQGSEIGGAKSKAMFEDD